MHRRTSIRLKGFDYSRDGLYFITICTSNREYLFGEIENQQMILNDYGKIADECWLQIPRHFPDVILHEHIIMPNHIHGIIEISKNDSVEGLPLEINVRVDVGAQNFEPLHQPFDSPTKQHKFQKIIPRSVGSIVRGYKIGVTKWFRANTDIYTVWQRNFHDSIIKDEKAYQTISNYIINNPVNWKDDKFYIKPQSGEE